MKISRIKFIVVFLVSAFAFQFISNSLLEPVNGKWFPETGLPIHWKHTLAAILYPVKIVLVEPLSSIFNDPDLHPDSGACLCFLPDCQSIGSSLSSK